MLLAHRTLHCCFGGKEHMSVVQCLQSWIGVGKAPSPASFERLPLDSQEEGFPDVDTCGHLGKNALWYGTTPSSFYVLLSSAISIDLTPLSPETSWDLIPKIGVTSVSGNLDLPVTLRWCPTRAIISFSRLWIFRLIILPFSFPESQGRLVKSC